MKLIILVLVFFQLFLGKSFALNAENYTNFIDELSKDKKFLEEYAKWSFKLFSQPDYLYGKIHDNFPCEITKDTTVPTSVHTLRLSDIKCVGAIGDSLTAGLGAHAINPLGLVIENRGLSWSIGGDQTYSTVLSLPNAIREYNPDLQGYSTKTSIIFLNGQNAKNNGLNVAKSGDRSTHMPGQAELLMSRIKDDKLCDWDNDWKVITFFVGGNDLCSFCEDKPITKHTPEEYLKNVRDTLDTLYNASLPRTFVNLVLVLDVRGVQVLNTGGFVCEVLHKRTCPCAAFPTPEDSRILDDFIPQYHELLLDLANSNRYDGREDFTVVVQPFLAKTKLPMKSDNEVDFSYFAPDCFHFSGKGHAQAALSLWNNMLEPVGAKQEFWHINEELKCPTKEYPYIFTKKNSAKALEEYQRLANVQVTSRASSMISTSSEASIDTTKHHKHHKSHSDSSLSKMQMIGSVGLFVLILVLIALIVSKRQQIRIYIHGRRRHHINGFNNPQYPDDNDDDVEVWNRANIKSNISSQNNIPKTHGSRISLE